MQLLDFFDDVETMAVANKLVSKRSARVFAEDGIDREAREYYAFKSPKFDELVPNRRERSGSTSTSTSRTSAEMSVEVAVELPHAALYAGNGTAGQLAIPVDIHAVNEAAIKLRDVLGQEASLFPNRPDPHVHYGLTYGQPINFGIVVPGVYRSSYPKAEDYSFMQSLGLKTIVTLVQKDFPEGYESFISENGIRHTVFNTKGTKKEDIPIKTMKSILRLVLDRQNHPLLIHCNHGKHRTGCVVAVVRKVSGWELSSIIDEYKSYAGPKIRECDIKYITTFELSKVSNLFVRESNFQFRVRSFFRVSIFAFFVLVIWLVSGTKMATQRRYKYSKE